MQDYDFHFTGTNTKRSEYFIIIIIIIRFDLNETGNCVI